MKAYSINPQTKELKSIDIEMQANTVYTFFNSILIDEIESLKMHTIYTDANAISNEKKPFFIGEQLIVGDALILGKDGILDSDISILEDDLQSLINYEVPSFYTDAFKLLKASDINLYTMFSIDNEEKTQLNTEWVLHLFSIANIATQDYFLNELKKSVDAKEDIQKTIEKMAKLAYNAANS